MIAAHQPVDSVATALCLMAAVQSEPGFPAGHIGLHLGPTVERNRDYFGATVNLAARVTAYARSDQILCTASVAETAQPLNIAIFRSVGAGHFKNVAQPVALFEIEDPNRRTAHSEIDPVCRMRLDPECAPARLPFGDLVYYFCSFKCAQVFAHAPEAHIKS